MRVRMAARRKSSPTCASGGEVKSAGADLAPGAPGAPWGAPEAGVATGAADDDGHVLGAAADTGGERDAADTILWVVEATPLGVLAAAAGAAPDDALGRNLRRKDQRPVSRRQSCGEPDGAEVDSGEAAAAAAAPAAVATGLIGRGSLDGWPAGPTLEGGLPGSWLLAAAAAAAGLGPGEAALPRGRAILPDSAWAGERGAGQAQAGRAHRVRAVRLSGQGSRTMWCEAQTVNCRQGGCFLAGRTTH